MKNMKYHLPGIFSLFAIAIIVFQLPIITGAAQEKMDRIQLWNEREWFLLGVNYPWFNYGHDFGTTAWGHHGVSSVKSTEQIDSDFADLYAHGVRVIRWFMFGDGRASPEFNEAGEVSGFDAFFFPDFDAALTLAEKHDLYLVLVLFDFHLADKSQDVNGVQLGGRSRLISDSHIRETLLENALRPLLERYAENRRIIAWEVMNEPEGAMNIPGGQWVDESVNPEVMQSFVAEVVSYIRAYSSQYVTLGSASRGWLLEYWTNSDLDFYQYHYYDHLEMRYPFNYLYSGLGVNKPVVVGEFPTRNTRRSINQYLDTIWENGYAGAWAWSYRAGDKVSDFESVADNFATWSEAHKDDVNIQFASDK